MVTNEVETGVLRCLISVSIAWIHKIFSFCNPYRGIHDFLTLGSEYLDDVFGADKPKLGMCIWGVFLYICCGQSILPANVAPYILTNVAEPWLRLPAGRNMTQHQLLKRMVAQYYYSTRQRCLMDLPYNI